MSGNVGINMQCKISQNNGNRGSEVKTTSFVTYFHNNTIRHY